MNASSSRRFPALCLSPLTRCLPRRCRFYRASIAAAIAAVAAAAAPSSPAVAQGQEEPPPSPPPIQQQQRWLMGRREARFASHEGNMAFLALGVGLPLLTDGGQQGRTRSLRTLDALVTSTALCYALKGLTRQLRPDNSKRDSFPSGHATAAFAVAAMQSSFHRDQAPLWYTGAALIAYSRVRLNRHRPRDAVVGAALGVGTAEGQIAARRGLILSPFLVPRPGGGLALGWNGSF